MEKLRRPCSRAELLLPLRQELIIPLPNEWFAIAGKGQAALRQHLVAPNTLSEFFYLKKKNLEGGTGWKVIRNWKFVPRPLGLEIRQSFRLHPGTKTQNDPSDAARLPSDDLICRISVNDILVSRGGTLWDELVRPEQNLDDR